MDPRAIVLSVIAHTLKTPAAVLTEEKLLADLAPDSIALFELLINFEKVLGQTIRYEDIANIETVGDIISCARTVSQNSFKLDAIPGLVVHQP